MHSKGYPGTVARVKAGETHGRFRFCAVVAMAISFFLPGALPAQDAVLDSIRQTIERMHPDDTTIVIRYLDLAGVASSRGKPAAVVEAIQASVRVAERQGRPFGRAKALVAYGMLQMMQGAAESGIADVKKGIALYRQIGDKAMEARALYLFGSRLSRIGRVDEAFDALREAEKAYTVRRDSAALFSVWNDLGATYHRQGMMKEAVTYFMRCLDFAEAKQLPDEIATSLVNVANTLPASESERAIAYYRRAERYFAGKDDVYRQMTILQAMGVTMSLAGRDGEALAALEQALSLADRQVDVPTRLAVMNSLAIVYAKLGMREPAAKLLEQHAMLSRKLNDPLQLAMSLVNLANEWNAAGKFAEAEPKLLEAIRLLEQQGEKQQLLAALAELVRSYEGRGDSLRAYAAFRRRTQLAEEVQGMETQRHISELTMKYDAVHREAEITRLEQEKEIQALSLRGKEGELERQRLLAEERAQAIRLLEQKRLIGELELGRSEATLALRTAEGQKKGKELALLKTREELQASVIDRQTTERNALIGGLVLLALIAVLGIWRIQGRRREAALRAEAAEAESLRVMAQSAQREQEAQREYTTGLIRSQESERQRIAQELHDSISQSLLVMRNRALLGLRDSAEPARMEEQLQLISELAAESVNEVRSISQDLRPTQLERIGLTETIRSAVDAVASSTDIRLTAAIADIDRILPPESEIAVYRIVQEAVNNVLKHSGANEAVISATRDDGTVRIVITDDGRGLNPSSARSRGGMGLRGMEERVRMLGGRFAVDGAPGRGTTVVVDLPLPVREAVDD